MIVTTKATVATIARLVTLLAASSLDTRSGMRTPMPPELMATSEVSSAEMPIAVRRNGLVSLVADVATAAWTSLASDTAVSSSGTGMVVVIGYSCGCGDMVGGVGWGVSSGPAINGR